MFLDPEPRTDGRSGPGRRFEETLLARSGMAFPGLDALEGGK